MSEPLVIQSHRGPYTVVFDDAFARLNEDAAPNVHVLVDARVAGLYARDLARVLARDSVLRIDATEASKSLERFTGYVEHLVAHRVRRGDVLVAIGGGVVQDITAFLAATLLRGLEWDFYPTTLLAQADSCIGSKSSINVGGVKNVLGTFAPPRGIFVVSSVLDTLEELEVRSGIGEMLKAHAVDGPEAFDQIARDYGRILQSKTVLASYVRRSLEIKKRLVEQDEFDRGARQVLNYGHSFGHAIESATDFAVPHGIAVTIGMDLANYVAAALGLSNPIHYERMHPALAANYVGFEELEIPLDAFFEALDRDKKNTSTTLGLILPDATGRVARCSVGNDAAFRAICEEYLRGGRRRDSGSVPQGAVTAPSAGM